MARVVRTQLSRRDLEEIALHIAESSGSPDVADKFLDSIQDRCHLYASHPMLGESCPNLGEFVRRFSMGSYVVYFRPRPDGILLLRVVHGGRSIKLFE